MEIDNKLKVCMLINYFSPVVGGTETAAFRLSRELVLKGIKTFVVTRRLKGLKKHEEIEAIPVYRLFTAGKGKMASITFMISVFIFLVKHRKEYSVIHVHLVSSHAICAAMAGRLLNKKVIIKFAGGSRSGDVALSSKSPVGRIKLALIKRRTDYFVCPSREIEREIKASDFPANKIRVIPNGIDTDLFSPVAEGVRRELRKTFELPDVPTVVYVGRLYTGKGLDILSKAWQGVTEVFANARLLIVGDGFLKEELVSQVKELKIEKNVDFIGEAGEVYKYLQLSNIFVLPSLAEGMSNALLEAMSCGLPVVTTDIGGTNEVIVNNENGIMVEANNINQLMEKIILLLRDTSLANRMGINARKTIEEEFSIGKIAGTYLKLYKKQ